MTIAMLLENCVRAARATK
ncbi:MAG: hypothetical protein ABR570_09625 [Burkholderiales bacterium]